MKNIDHLKKENPNDYFFADGGSQIESLLGKEENSSMVNGGSSKSNYMKAPGNLDLTSIYSRGK